MRLNRHLATSGLLFALAFAFPARAVDTPAVSQWLVTSAKATGKNGENFVSSLRLVNGTTASTTVDVTYYPRVNFDKTTNSASGDNSVNAMTATVTVPAGQTLAVDDVLNTLFGVTLTSASGGLDIESNNLDVPISVLSQTLVTNAKAADGTPGTYGFAIPGQVLDNAVAVGDTAYVPYLSSATADQVAAREGYRSNLFLQTTNASGNTVVNVTLLNGADGSTLGATDVTLGTLVQTQINDIAGFFGYSDTNTNLTAVVTVKSGGPIFLGASVNDNATGSQVYAPPTKDWAPRNASFGLIFGDGYGFGGRLDIKPDGTTDLFTAEPVIDLCPTDPAVFLLQTGPSYTPNTSNFTLNPDGSTSFTGSDGESTWSGAFKFNPDGSVQGNLTYTLSSVPSPTNPCPGGTVTVPFFGRKVLDYGIY